jgi:hypothetical protein
LRTPQYARVTPPRMTEMQSSRETEQSMSRVHAWYGPTVAQAPQSPAQLPHVSPRPESQKPSPHGLHAPQSVGHVLHVSPALHAPSGQPVHGPQSGEQFAQFSPTSQMASPHRTPVTRQSVGHDALVSGESQNPSPQRATMGLQPAIASTLAPKPTTHIARRECCPMERGYAGDRARAPRDQLRIASIENLNA